MVDVEFETRDGRTLTIPRITIPEKEQAENLRPLEHRLHPLVFGRTQTGHAGRGPPPAITAMRTPWPDNSATPPKNLAFQSAFHLILCVTVSRPNYSKPAPTSAPCRIFSAMPTWNRAERNRLEQSDSPQGGRGGGHQTTTIYLLVMKRPGAGGP